ncbi:MAG: hypothetical protein J6V40_04830 [Clostridia bacterium]|jgi:hypothetical protein|nr:hypothetical protein [Clostridia bacterium]
MTAKKTLFIIAGVLRIVSAVVLLVLALLFLLLQSTLATELVNVLIQSNIKLADFGINLGWEAFTEVLTVFMVGLTVLAFLLATLCIVSSIFMFRTSMFTYNEFETKKTRQIVLCVLSWFSGLPVSSILVTVAINLKLNKDKIVNEAFEKFNKEEESK